MNNLKNGDGNNFIKHPLFYDYGSLHNRVDRAGIIIGAGFIKLITPGL
jgi:hypothetical protein